MSEARLIERLMEREIDIYRRAGVQKDADGRYQGFHTDAHLHRQAASEIERLKAALERIALLDEADGHELTRQHAFAAVAIATSTLGKHPSEITAERPARALSSSPAPLRMEGEWWCDDMEKAPKDGTEILLWWPFWSRSAIPGRWDAGSGDWHSLYVLSDGPGPRAWQLLPKPPAA